MRDREGQRQRYIQTARQTARETEREEGEGGGRGREALTEKVECGKKKD